MFVRAPVGGRLCGGDGRGRSDEAAGGRSLGKGGVRRDRGSGLVGVAGPCPRWWPDVRADVDDVVSFVGPNRGTLTSNLVFCGSGECIPPDWQFSRGSAFIEALDRVSTPEGPSYTAIYTQTDWVNQPSWPESQ